MKPNPVTELLTNCPYEELFDITVKLALLMKIPVDEIIAFYGKEFKTDILNIKAAYNTLPTFKVPLPPRERSMSKLVGHIKWLRLHRHT